MKNLHRHAWDNFRTLYIPPYRELKLLCFHLLTTNTYNSRHYGEPKILKSSKFGRRVSPRVSNLGRFFVVSNAPIYEANFVLASLSKDGDSQTSKSQPQNSSAQQNTTAGANRTTNSTMRGNNLTNRSEQISNLSSGFINKRDINMDFAPINVNNRQTLRICGRRYCALKITSLARALLAIIFFLIYKDPVTLTKSSALLLTKNKFGKKLSLKRALNLKISSKIPIFENYFSSTIKMQFYIKELRKNPSSSSSTILPKGFEFREIPIVFVVSNAPIYEANFVLASLSKDGDSQTSKSQPQNSSAQQNTTAGANRTTNSTMRGNNLTNRSEQISNLSSGFINKREIFELIQEPSISSVNGHLNNSTALKNAQRPGPDARTSLNSTSQLKGYMNRSIRPADISLPNVSMNKTVVTGSDDEDADTVPGTPPSKKARYLFKRCFESTFNPDNIPGREHVLAADSGSDGESF
ncbi:unnamed protein product, partial [Meganyctiphanes norvegica]